MMSMQSLISAHNKLPATSSDDRRGPGTFVSDTVKAGTYIKQNDENEFWYTIHKSEDQIIPIDCRIMNLTGLPLYLIRTMSG